MENTNKKQLFLAACISLIVTAMTFAIRAGMLSDLGEQFSFNDTQLGWINGMAFAGFPIATIFGGLLYNSMGARKLMIVAFLSHLLSLILTIFAGGFWTLLISTFLIGFANGSVEAACNPMIADTYEGNMMSKMMNRFHMWFPGGIVVGSLVSKFMTDAGFGWESQIWVIMIPTLIYLFLFLGSSWPKAKVAEATSISSNFKAMLSPLFLFMMACMALTAISEFGPQQWSSLILAKSGAQPMLILALVTGVMAVARFFGGEVVHQFNTTGVLLGSAVLATLGVFLFSTQTGTMAYVAAFVFALGVAYFWPNMIGFIADYIPESGALGMSIVGAVGMFSTSIFQPIIGRWIDSDKAAAAATGLKGDELELVAGQATLGTMVSFPAILIVLFTILYFWMKKRESTSA